MPSRSFLVLVAALGLAGVSRECRADAAYPGRFLQSEFLPVGARYLGMGGGHVALPGGASAAYVNPALLPWRRKLEFAVEGSYVSGPVFETEGGDNRLEFFERGNLDLIGLRLPDAGGFSFAILEATVYDHDLRGYLFGAPPEWSEKPIPEAAPGRGTALADQSDSTILDYQDRVTVRSFGFATGYKGSENTSFGIGVWIDRKKVFQSIDYPAAHSGVSAEAVENGWYDAEAATNDISLHMTGGVYHRISDRLDGGLSLGSGSDLRSVHQIDEWPGGEANRRPIVADEIPFSVQAGLAYYDSRNLRFAGDVVYQNWGNLAYHKSVVQASLGAEWDESERLVLRGGFFTVFDPSDLPEGMYAESLRDIERSGNILSANEYFVTVGAGFWLTPYLLLDGAYANSEILSPEGGRHSLLFAARFLIEPEDG